MKTRLHRRGPNPRPQAAHGNSWTTGQLAEWGIAWPPPTGWRAELEERWFREHTEERKRPARVARIRPPPHRFRYVTSPERRRLLEQFRSMSAIAEQLDDGDIENLYDDVTEASLNAAETHVLGQWAQMREACEEHLDRFRPRDQSLIVNLRKQAPEGTEPSSKQIIWLATLYNDLADKRLVPPLEELDIPGEED